MTLRPSWRERRGLWRSMLMYYGIPGRQARMRRLYGQFIRPGDLCFDIGAHLGNRLLAWRGLGARAIALEPQPLLMQSLKKRYGQDPEIRLLAEAAGASPGRALLHISSRTPTVATMSGDWMARVRQDPSFQSVQWDQEIEVPVTTLDALIAEWGEPRFCKIDVEGFELNVLQGLSRPLAALSFEYIPATMTMALDCIRRLQALGDYEYNLSPGETHRLRFRSWYSATQMASELERISSGSGDIYARRSDIQWPG